MKDIFLDKSEKIKVLLVGNNPQEISRLVKLISKSNQGILELDYCFNRKDLFDRLQEDFDCIVIDDSCEREKRDKLINYLTNRFFLKHIPIVLYKDPKCIAIPRNPKINSILWRSNLTYEKVETAIVKAMHRKLRVKKAA